MKKKNLVVPLLILLLPCFSSAARKPIFIIGLGGGYSKIADSGIRSGEYVYDSLIDFKEKLRLKNRWSVNLQAYILRDVGIQLDYSHQRAGYFSHLKWYGWWFENEYIPINHFEAPYWHDWSITSLHFSVLAGGNRPLFGELFPYVTAGFGTYQLKADPELFLDRSRFGPRTKGTSIKLSGGVRYRILPFLGINLRISGETLWRNQPISGISYYEFLYEGPDQLSLEDYYLRGKIVRVSSVLIRSFSYLGIELSLELILRLPNRKK
ncbi:MAG: hypothetical protein PVF22_02200 [Candidatus Aminicenantes bacterium]